MSLERGGTPFAVDPASGAERWRHTDLRPASDVLPSLAPGAVVWTAGGTTAPSTGIPPWGELVVTDVLGATGWRRGTWAPLRGAAALDPATADLFVARGPAPLRVYVEGVLRSIGTGIESYYVDNGFVPAPGDPEPLIVPTFLRCMPQHPAEARAMRYAATPSPGDYDYVPSPARDSYEVSMWDEQGGQNGVYSNGNFIVSPRDLPPAVLSLDATGAPRWLTPIGTTLEDVTPVALREDGMVLVGTRSGSVIALAGADGSESWRASVGGSLSLAPALRADGSVVAVTDNGDVASIDPAGGVEWVVPTGSPALAAPTVTADGVTYAPGADGTLRALERSGAVRWQIPLGGTRSAALTTAAIQADGWVFVGRSDGYVVALGPSLTGGGPAPVANTLFAVRRGADVGFEWTPAAPGLPAACRHVVRRSASPLRLPGDARAATVPPDLPLDPGAVPAAPSLVYYRVHAATCCGREGP